MFLNEQMMSRKQERAGYSLRGKLETGMIERKTEYGLNAKALDFLRCRFLIACNRNISVIYMGQLTMMEVFSLDVSH